MAQIRAVINICCLTWTQINMSRNLVSDRSMGNVAKNKLKNWWKFPKVAGTKTYIRYGSSIVKSRTLEGITLVDSIADRKNLVVVSLVFMQILFLGWCICLSQGSPSVTVIVFVEVELLFCVTPLPQSLIHGLEFQNQAYEEYCQFVGTCF